MKATTTMPDTTPKLPLTSADPVAERRAQLRELFPDAFQAGQLDTERLAQLIGQTAPPEPERYGLSWAGKAEALRAVQSLSTATLRPAPEQSVNFATTGNVVIEGDNLEVLKLLQKSYHRKVKMIYIDPPYNTGNEFIYPDNFREGLQTYLEYTAQVRNGVRQTTNAETNGRYHSNWLTMMYPRLFLARNLLRDDGVIFVSIDDHEVHNLRLLMNEVFGEENFVATIIWQKKYTRSNDATFFSVTHDHILVYSRFKEQVTLNLTPRGAAQEASYKNPDNHPKGVWKSTPLHAKSGSNIEPYIFKNGIVWKPPLGTYRRFSEDTMNQLDRNNEIWFGSSGQSIPSRKTFLAEAKQGMTPTTMWLHEEAGHTHEANNELKELELDGVFDNPKPTRLINKMIQLSTSSDDLILDFFAGSGTTAQAVIELNQEDSGNRHFILVQLPEQTSRPDYPTIAAICRERVRRAIQKRNDADASTLPLNGDAPQDRGFKAFRLDSSNFKVWDGDGAVADDPSELAQQLALIADHRLPDRTAQDVLYELLLKSGRPLTAPIATHTIADLTVYDVDDGRLLICLADPITELALQGMLARRPERVLCLDAGFGGNDELKTNVVLQMRAASVEFRTV